MAKNWLLVSSSLICFYLHIISINSTGIIPTGVGEKFVIFPGNTECAKFEDIVTKSGHLWFLLFKKAYCPWCKEFDFEWQAASYDLRSSPRVRFAEVDIHRCGNIASKFGARNAPTTVLVSGNNFEIYQGPKSASGLVSASSMALGRWKVDLIGQLDSIIPIKIVDSSSLDIDIISNTMPTVLVVSSKWPPPPSLLDPRLKAFNIQPAFATHDIQFHDRLQTLLSLNKFKLLKLNETIYSSSSSSTLDLSLLLQECDDIENDRKQQSNRRKKKNMDIPQYVYIFPPLTKDRLPLPMSSSSSPSSSLSSEIEAPDRTSDNKVQDGIVDDENNKNNNKNTVEADDDNDDDGCDASCFLWELDIHALNIRNAPSSQGAVIGIMKKNMQFYASCQLATSSSSTSILSELNNPHCAWLRICPCETSNPNPMIDSGSTIESSSINNNALFYQTKVKNNFLTRVGDITDSSSIRVVLANSPRFMFQISPLPSSSSSSLNQAVVSSSSSSSSLNEKLAIDYLQQHMQQGSSSKSNLVTSTTDWIYSHLSIWYLVS